MATWLLWLYALGFVGVGVASLLEPVKLAGLVEIPLATATARADFAAVYGGFQVGFGVFLSLCARRPAWHRPGLVASLLAVGGFGLGRGYSLVTAGGTARPLIYWFLALEIALTLLALAALVRLNRAADAA